MFIVFRSYWVLGLILNRVKKFLFLVQMMDLLNYGYKHTEVEVLNFPNQTES